MTSQPVERFHGLAPGDVIGGKYQIEGAVGTGGMGIVLAARHLILKQRVAVKVLLPEAAALPEATERFLREAQAAAAMQGEHVARVLDMGTLPDGTPYLVMELLTGLDFVKLLRWRGPLPIPEAVDLILQASEGVAEAHALGIVHRDLKPGNLFLTTRPDGTPLVKVLDFGLSKATSPGASDGSLTATTLVVGSSYYMAPEQFRGLRYADARTDLWALGVILFQLISGRRPFEGDSFGAVCASVAADPPLSLREARPDAPPELEAVLLRCLEKDRNRRVQTVAELAQALAPFGTPAAASSVERVERVLMHAGRSSLVDHPGATPGGAPGSGPAPGAAPSGSGPKVSLVAAATAAPAPGPAAMGPPAAAGGAAARAPGAPRATTLIWDPQPLPGPAAAPQQAEPAPQQAEPAPQQAAPPHVSAPAPWIPPEPPPAPVPMPLEAEAAAGPETLQSSTARSSAWGNTSVHPRRRGPILIAGGAVMLFAVILIASLARLGSDEADGAGEPAQAAPPELTTPARPPEPSPEVSPASIAPPPPSGAASAKPGAEPPAKETTSPKSPRPPPPSKQRPTKPKDALDRWDDKPGDALDRWD